jgi:hypothetical protein
MNGPENDVYVGHDVIFTNAMLLITAMIRRLGTMIQ